MHVDNAVELGRDDPALEMPWASEDGSLRYCDIRTNPVLVDTLPEAQHSLEMREFLIRTNAADFPMQSAKSDLWSTTEMSPEEEIFSASWKFGSYIDLIFSDHAPRFSLRAHQRLMTKLCALLQRAPDMPASLEFVLRHCYYHVLDDVARASDSEESRRQDQHREEHSVPEKMLDDSARGFCLTMYVSGFGNTEQEAQQRWSIALKLLQHALIQLCIT